MSENEETTSSSSSSEEEEEEEEEETDDDDEECTSEEESEKEQGEVISFIPLLVTFYLFTKHFLWGFILLYEIGSRISCLLVMMRG